MPTLTDAGSTVPRRQLGRRLRQLREEAGITVKAAADALEWSTPKLWRIEGGMVSMRSLDVEAMCRVYSAPAGVTEELMSLAKQTRARGWWHAYADVVPGWFELYVGLEAAATRLRTYAPEVVPGLLRTAAYAEEVIRTAQTDLTDQTVRRMLAVSAQRQAALSRQDPPPPQLEVVLSEPVLRRPLHDRAAMAEQIHRVVALAERPNVSIRVLPLDAGLHPATSAGGTFTILTFTGGPGGPGGEAEPPTVYHEGLTAASYLDKPADIEAYDTAWDGLGAVALDETASRAVLRAAAKEYG
ncbi:helix-turn-helix domain-containing protein [Plantactinospora sp. GCM10030261]|uniref:helix-turn-helix domain-containing protein n=1 Tax=Plantactinospora sp. GCM10030261 TaxID=3273420 RepID=UPI003606AC53